MNKDEMKNKISMALKDPILQQGFEIIYKENAELKAYNEKLLNGDIEKHNKIVELEKKISVLLSCKNCPENKGGLLCQKEYEDKCLAQKIQYIKELQEENAELKEKYLRATDEGTSFAHLRRLESLLSKAKEIIKELLFTSNELDENTRSKAEQFLKEE